MYLDGSSRRIHQPIFLHAKTRVGFELDPSVARLGRGREDFHGQIRRATDPVLDNLGPLVEHEEQVGLENFIVAEDDVERRDKHLADAMVLEIVEKCREDVDQNCLVICDRRGRHKHLPINNLPPQVVFGKREKVSVRDLGSYNHGLIIASFSIGAEGGGAGLLRRSYRGHGRRIPKAGAP